MKHPNLVAFAVAVLVVAIPGAIYSVYLTTPLFYEAWVKEIVQQGVGAGPIPVNTISTESSLPGPNSTKVSPALRGANYDTLYTGGVLDLSVGPMVLNVPDMSSRYYSIQLTDLRGVDFAYVGTRTTGTQAGDYLISGPGWSGTVPQGLRQIVSTDNTVLLLGRVLVYNDTDVSTAYNLSKQIQLTPLSH